jgi:hypothetical protein
MKSDMGLDKSIFKYLILFTIIPLILLIGIVPSLPFIEGALESQDITIQKQDLLYTTQPLTTKQLEECEDIYEDYTTLDENTFGQRYLYHKFVGNCVMLFDDPVWETQGAYRYEDLADRLFILISMREAERLQQKSQVMNIDVKSVTELQIEGTYLVTFEGCSGDKYVNLDDIVISSDTEVISVVPPGTEGIVVSPGTCRIVEYQIRADDPDSIRVMVPAMAIEKGMALGGGFEIMSPRQQMKLGAALNDVVCKEGLQLMKKTSDGTAACVKPTSVDRLIQRGWGTVV